MDQPPGFVQVGPDSSPLVCHLLRSLYGLKQAPCAWFHRLRDALCSLGFTYFKADPCVFIRKSDSSVAYLIVYVDDLLLTGSNTSEL